MLPLRMVLHGKLQNSWIAGAGNLPEAGVAQRSDGRREVDVIGVVESREPDFQTLRFLGSVTSFSATILRDESMPINRNAAPYSSTHFDERNESSCFR